MSLSNIIIYETQKEVAKALAGVDDVSVIDEYGYTPLIEAVIVDDIEKVKMVVEAKADINQTDITGRTALHWAVFNNNINIAEYLLDCGADANIYNMVSEPIIVKTLLKQDKALIKKFCDNGADLTVAHDYINTKLLGHRFELQGSVDIVTSDGRFAEVDFEGFYLEFSLALITHSLKLFREQYISRMLCDWFDEIDKTAEALQTAQQWLKYDHYLLDPSAHDVEIQRWCKQDPLVVPINQEAHAFVLVKCGNYFSICDRSEFTEKPDEIPIYYMNKPFRLNKELLMYVVYQKNDIKPLYGLLKQELGLHEIATFPVRSQITGNCSWANVEAVIPILFYMLKADDGTGQTIKKSELLTDSLELFHRWREWDTGRALQFFMQQFRAASPARKASIAALLGDILFQRFSADIEEHVEWAKKIIPILKTRGYEYILDSYIRYYVQENPTKVGANLMKMLDIYEREEDMG